MATGTEGAARRSGRQSSCRTRQLAAEPLAAARPQRRHPDRPRRRLCPALAVALAAIVAEVEIDRHSGKVWARNSRWRMIAG